MGKFCGKVLKNLWNKRADTDSYIEILDSLIKYVKDKINEK